MVPVLDDIKDFLRCETPSRWIEVALEQQDLLLIDHAHCEKKAASTALSMLYRYPQHAVLLQKLSRLAREELRHFEQVLKIMTRRNITYRHLTPARYAAGLHQLVRRQEPARLIDSLIIGAFIEARSCERFSILSQYLDHELKVFYQGLLSSEARHYQDYLQLAAALSSDPLEERIALFAAHEAELISTPDDEFRFHSGEPVKGLNSEDR